LRESILILDDEASILEILSQHLNGEHYRCRTTTSPVQALELLQREAFDLLVTDLKMPELDGMEVVKRAKAADNDLAIIVVTALIEVTRAIDALRAGADDYVLKPFNLGEISLAVGKALEKRSLVKENRKYQKDLESRVHEATQDLARINEELLSTKQYLENLIHSTVDAIITTDLSGIVEFVNEGVLHMLGYSREEFVGAPLADFYVGGVDEAAYVRRILRNDHPLQNYETEFRHKNGAAIPVNISVSLVKDTESHPASLLFICKDITEQKRLERELKEMSIKDSLSGLYNQRYFYDRLEAEIERARRQAHPLSLLLFDIDQFKAYNDCHGHLEGDKVLQEAGRVVMESTREHVDLGFRYGGDEFTVLLPEADEPQAFSIAERIRTTFRSRHFDHLTLSIGLMSYREAYSMRTFIQFADAMMYDAKRRGGDQVMVYRPGTGFALDNANAP